MFLLFFRSLVRTFSWLVLAVSGGLVGLLLLVQIIAVPLWPVEGLFALVLSKAAAPLQISIDGVYLHWSRRHFLPYLSAKKISFSDSNGAQISLQDVTLVPSGKDFWLDGALYPSEFSVHRAIMQPGQISTIIPLGTRAPSLGFLQAIHKVSISHIDILSPDGQQIISKDSRLLVIRTDNRLVSVLNIDYWLDKQRTQINSRAVIEPGVPGWVSINLQNLSPQQLVRFNRAFAPLGALKLPISAQADLQLDSRAQPINGTMAVRVKRGEIDLYGQQFAVNQFAVNMHVDFPAGALAIDNGMIEIEGVSANFQGNVDYTLSADGRLKTATALLSSDKLAINHTSLFRKAVNLDNIFTELYFDAASQQITLERLSLLHQNGTIEIGGDVFLEDIATFDITLKTGAFSRADVESFWPVPVAPRTYEWVQKNVSGGRLLQADLHLSTNLRELFEREKNQALPEDALLLDLRLADGRVTILKGWPPLDIANAQIALRGKSFEATMDAGQMQLPPTPHTIQNPEAQTNNALANSEMGNLTAGHLFIADYRATGVPAQIGFSGRGEIRRILALLQKPPLNLLRGTLLDSDSIDGFASADVKLNFPLFRSLAADKSVNFEVVAHSDKIDMLVPIGAYQVKQSTVDMQLNNERLIMNGAGKVNEVGFEFYYQRPLNADIAQSKPERLTLTGQLVPQDMVRLGQSWIGRRFEGTADVTLTADGSVFKPANLRVDADFTGAKLTPVPLAFEKPAGVGGRVLASVVNDEKGAPQRINFDVQIDNEQPVRGILQLNGKLVTELEMSKLNLGRTKNLQLKVNTHDGLRHLHIEADDFDMRKLLSYGNKNVKIKRTPFVYPFDFLGENYAVEVRVNQAYGDYGEILHNLQFLLNSKDGRYERARLQGSFDDGTELIGSLNRAGETLRQYHFQSENGSNVFRLFGAAKNVEGGVLSVQGDIFDNKVNNKGQVITGTGQFNMLDFRTKKVPLLARLFSLVSVQGLIDTLSGEGIKFRKAEFGFGLKNSILTIDEGRMNGAAIGLTMHGDIDINTAEIDLGGNVIPAFSLNNFITHVPIIGTILGGREGEGILGVGYRITSGTDGQLTVVGNPLSLFTPGIFRRIFEIGIGIDSSDEDIEEDEFENMDEG